MPGRLKLDPELFPEYAVRHSEDPVSSANGGSLGWTDFGTFVEEYESAVAGLSPGQVSEPVLSRFGYHVILVEELREASYRTLEESRELISDRLVREKLRNRLEKLAEEVRSGEKGKTLEDYAGKYGKESARLEGFDSSAPFAVNPQRLYEPFPAPFPAISTFR